MEVPNPEPETEGDAVSDVQQQIVTVQCVEISSENSDVTDSDSTNRLPKRRRSRQVYTLAFKLSVVEAYRNNGECKGNQRATARKFHIHRRQVQRWIKDEKALIQKFKARIAVAALTDRDSERADVADQTPGINTDQRQSSSVATTTCGTKQSTDYFMSKKDCKRKIVDVVPATSESTSGNEPHDEDAVIDLSMPRRRNTLEEQVINITEIKYPQPSLKPTVLAAYHSANKWHGVTAAVAQKFGIMVCELRRWLKEEQEQNAVASSAIVPSHPSQLSNDAFLSENSNPNFGRSVVPYTNSTVQKQNVRETEATAQQYTEETRSTRYERSAGSADGLSTNWNFYLDAVLAAEAMKYFYRQLSQRYFVGDNVMRMETLNPCATVPGVPASVEFLPQLVLSNSQFPAVRGPTQQPEDQK